MMGMHGSWLGGMLSALLLFNGAPRCVPAAKLLLNLSHLLDADHLEEDKPASRVHCEDAKNKDRVRADFPSDPLSNDDDECRCQVVSVSLA